MSRKRQHPIKGEGLSVFISFTVFVYRVLSKIEQNPKWLSKSEIPSPICSLKQLRETRTSTTGWEISKLILIWLIIEELDNEEWVG